MSRFVGLLGFLVVSFICGNLGQAAQVVGGASGSCINLPEHSGTAADGTRVRLFHCHGTSNQIWSVSSGQIMSGSGSCLDVQGSAPTVGAQIVIMACSGGPSQQWSVAHGQIIGLGGKCLDVERGSTADTSPIILVTCSASPSHQWSLQ